MFTYFHDHKLKYNKGQLAPFFIVIMVAILMMALVTVNLSKVALTKTESANSADAGALAGGSVMANVFNSIAMRNAALEFQFWTFFTSISVTFAIAVTSLAVALATACVPGCTADIAANIAWWSIFALIPAIFGCLVAQYLVYQTIRGRIAEPGWEAAVRAAHQFVFINAGIGSKLQEGAQRDDFKSFMENIVEHDPTYRYSWQDGQGRDHYVESGVTIESIDKFQMQTTALPYLAIITGVGAALYLTGAAIPILHMLCICSTIVTCPFLPACSGAVGLLIGAIAALAAAWVGLTPTGFIIEEDTDPGIIGAITSMWIYAWIDDINHNRKVEVRTSQHHGGANLGLWTAQYPDTFSSSRSDFRGNGDIHPPRLRHDASLEAVDFP